MNTPSAYNMMKFLQSLCVLFTALSLCQGYKLELPDFTRIIEAYGCRQVTLLENGTSYNMFFSNMLAAEGAVIAYNAAKEKTSKGWAENLGVPRVSTTNSFMDKLNAKLVGSRAEQRWFKSQHAVFVSSRFDIDDGFNETVTKLYGAQLHKVDFQDTAIARETVNELIASNTGDVIQEVLTPDALNENFTMIQVSGIHYRGHWSKMFDPSLTVPGVFHLNRTHEILAPAMMIECDEFDFYEDVELDAIFLSLPFQNGEADLLLQLPNSREGLALLEAQLQRTMAPPLRKTPVHLVLPKFQIRTRIDVKRIDDVLKSERGLFEAGNGDLSGLGGQPGQIGENLFYQQNYIRVNEAGIVVEDLGVSKRDSNRCDANAPDVIPFIVTHPFRFEIRRFGVVVAAGRVVDPTLPIDSHEVHPSASDYQ